MSMASGPPTPLPDLSRILAAMEVSIASGRNKDTAALLAIRSELAWLLDTGGWDGQPSAEFDYSTSAATRSLNHRMWLCSVRFHQHNHVNPVSDEESNFFRAYEASDLGGFSYNPVRVMAAMMASTAVPKGISRIQYYIGTSEAQALMRWAMPLFWAWVVEKGGLYRIRPPSRREE